MGLIGKLALGVVKEAATFVAVDIMEGNNNSFNQTVKSLESSHNEKLSEKADGRSLITIDNFTSGDSDSSCSVVRNNLGEVLYHLRKYDDGKKYYLYNISQKLIAKIVCCDAWYASVTRSQKPSGTVTLKLSLKGTYHTVSWNNWRIDSNLIGDKRTISSGEKQIAETKFVFLGKEQYVMYINEDKDIESVILARLATDAINAYRSDLAEKESKKESSRNEKQQKQENTQHNKQAPKEKKKEKKSLWNKLIDDNQPISYYDDWDPWDD